MAAVIIWKKDLDRLSRTLLKETFDFLHDEYILSNFEEMKLTQEIFLNSICLEHIETLFKSKFITEEKREELFKQYNNLENGKLYHYHDKDLVKKVMEEEKIDTDGIYKTLIKLRLDYEIYEDLYFKIKAFLDISRVFDFGYKYLED